MPNNDVEAILDDLRDAISAEHGKIKGLLAELVAETDRSAVNEALEELGKTPPEWMPELASYLAAYPGSIESHPGLEDLLFELILADSEAFERLLATTTDVRELEYYIHCTDALALESRVVEERLTTVSDDHLLISLLGAIARTGYCEELGRIADFLYAAEREVITAAVMALGSIGNEQAINALEERMGTDGEFDRFILDQFAEIQNQYAIGKLCEAIGSHQTHVRNHAKSKLVEIGAKVIPYLVEQLSSVDVDRVVHTLNVLGDIKDESSVRAIKNLLHEQPAEANIRFAAYEALSRLPSGKVALALAEGLSDADSNVRVAAARAINNSYSKMLGAGVKNLLRSTAFDQGKIVSAIVESESDQIFLDVINQEELRELLFAYIREQAHAEVVKFYTVILNNANLPGWAELIQSADKPSAAPKMLVYAIDDSRMILNIYRSALHKLGYEFRLFEFPETALQTIEEERPSFIFTDLNMPLISGIDLTAKLREDFDKDTLPIVMVTTQSENDSRNDALEAGVNAVISKPFTAKSLQAAIQRYSVAASVSDANRVMATA